MLLRVCPEDILQRGCGKNVYNGLRSTSQDSILRVEENRKHVTIIDSASGLQSAHKRVGVSAPKLYAFDAVFPESASQVTNTSDILIA